MKRELTVMCIMACLAACSSTPEQIEAANVSALKYKDYTCDEIETAGGKIKERMLAGDGLEAHELAQLKADFEALRENSTYKECKNDVFLPEETRAVEHEQAIREWKTKRNLACPRRMVSRGLCRHDWELTHPKPVP
ncbi:MAG: hypothetical protein OEU90_00415 [Gammaproteobacteria bacterium]|nr:hypothetical protein [Gammaproteobacteria bacterium]MDH3751466.1 hypothetical protein [Gammaproteobacteria bacterium]MDH3803910.1 hypothetical protein [Gammaproteobacteria bacterium]